MSNRFRAWKSLPPEHKDYLKIYVWGFFFAVSYLLFTPIVTYSVVGVASVWLWTIASSIGAVLAVIGLLTRSNLLLERLGVAFLMIAPIVYSLTQLGLFLATSVDPTLLSPGSTPGSRIYLIFLGFWSFWWLNKRRRQIKAQIKLSKDAPLDSESEAE